MKKKKFLPLLISLALATTASAQMADVLPQHYFKESVPAGNYSGLTYLGGNRYAVVNDKPKTDGFDIFTIDIDSITGEIKNVRQVRTLNSGLYIQRDGEGIAYFPKANTVFISGETDNKIFEYDMNGHLTRRELPLPKELKVSLGNYGLESLTYNAKTHRFWTTTESTLPVDGQQANCVNGIRNKLRLMAFDDSLHYLGYKNYIMDAPMNTKLTDIYVMGVSELCALDDGWLLVMEREAFVPKKRIGAWVVNKIYRVDTNSTEQTLQKRLVAMWRTTFNLTSKSFANYEGMCAGPRLVDGRQVIVLCADSQNQYHNMLHDWFRTIVLNK